MQMTKIPVSEVLEQEIRLLSLWQPWASLVATGVKRIETRHWSTNYRGLIAIHAAKRKIDGDGMELIRLLSPSIESYPYGGIVAVARLKDCSVMVEPEGRPVYCYTTTQPDPSQKFFPTTTEEMCGNWTAGRYAWFLEDIRPIDPPIYTLGLHCFPIEEIVDWRIYEMQQNLAGKYRKPAPGMLMYAMWATAVKGVISRFLYVGDRPEDEAAADLADVPFVWAKDWWEVR